MHPRKNNFGQPIGEEVVGWEGAARPARAPIEGRLCRVEALSVERHLEDLFRAFSDDVDGVLWTYMPAGPFGTVNEMKHWMDAQCASEDPLFFAITDRASRRATGVAAYLRIQPEVGVIEIGHIAYSSRLQRTPVATEAMFLFMKRTFDELGYRRYEWKCDALNKASRRAAERLGFHFDGVFRQATIYKGRNRDTAWYSMLDSDWPATKRAYELWLEPGNFDENGHQVESLRSLIMRECER